MLLGVETDDEGGDVDDLLADAGIMLVRRFVIYLSSSKRRHTECVSV